MEKGVFLVLGLVLLLVGLVQGQTITTSENGSFRLEIAPNLSQVSPNQQVTYTVRVTNISGATISNLFVSHFFPLTQSFSSSFPPANVSTTPSGTEAVWQIPSLAPSSPFFAAVVQIASTTMTGNLDGQTTVFNRFSVGAQGIPDLTTDVFIPISPSTPFEVVEDPNFRLAVSHTESCVSGGHAVYTILVTSKATTPFDGFASVNFTLTPQQTVVSANPPIASQGPNDIAWDFFSFGPGETIPITLTLSLGDLTGLTTLSNPVSLFYSSDTVSGMLELTISCLVGGGPQPPLSGVVQDNQGSVVTKEVTYHYTSQNKPQNEYIIRKPCPTGNTSCDLCPPCSALSGKYETINFQAGHPVFLNSLEFSETVTDLEIPGIGISYQLQRTYRSRINYRGPLGHNWLWNYDNIRVVAHPTETNQVILYQGDGRGDAYFVSTIDGAITPPPSHFHKMVRDTDGFLRLRQAQGSIYKFNPLEGSNKAGKLHSITTKCGHSLHFQYTDGKLTTVLDSLSRPITHEFDSTGRLVRVRDFLNREVVYSYNENGDLASVRSPLVTGTPNGNDFPAGKVYLYTYSSGFATDEKLNHNLISMTNPNEVAVGGAPYVVNTFDSDDRLLAQQWGGTNASSISSGGMITYARQVVNEGVDPNNPDLPREVVTVIDRRGNETVYSFNNNKQLIGEEVKTRGLRVGDPVSFITEYKYDSATGLRTEIILPEGNRILYEYNLSNADNFQVGNLLSVTRIPDAARGGDQAFHKISFAYEPVYNQVIRTIEERGNDPSFIPQNSGFVTPERYRREFIPDYFEGSLDQTGCACGFTLRQLVETWDIDISSIQSQLNHGDLNGDGHYSLCGNVIVTRYPSPFLRANSPQASVEGGQLQIVESLTRYNDFAQIRETETPEGEITLFLYHSEADPDGDGQDVRTGNNAAGRPFNTTTGGYLREMITDFAHSAKYRGTSAPTQLSGKYFSDPVGNIVATVNPRGIRSQYAVNSLNQVVEVTVAADVSAATEPGLVAHAYKARLFYDHNNNVVRAEQEYRDGNNPALPSFIESTVVYDILDMPLEVTQRVSNSETITAQMRYDPNQNLVEKISPLAVAGLQPGNRTLLAYDERDLPMRATGAPGTPEESTITYKVNRNGRTIEIIDSQDNNGDGLPESTLIFRDGFDRTVCTVDAVGNEVRLAFDPASNVIRAEVFGPLAGPSRSSNSTSGNVLLARGHALYDELSRVFQRDAELFVPAGVPLSRVPLLSEGDLTLGDGRVSRFLDFDRNSRPTFITSASLASAAEISSIEYDGASRAIRSRDPEGNEVERVFDKNSNAVRVTRTDKSPTGRVPNETFTTINVFDSLDRLVRSTDNLGQTRRFFWDSRNLLIRTSDAQGPSIPDPLGLFTGGNINGEGNVTEFLQDGLGRTLETRRELRIDGQGGNPLDLSNPTNPDGRIVETAVFDKNSRVVAVADDKANSTQYQYDNLNRRVLTLWADGTTTTAAFDRDSNPVQLVDHNGSVISQTFDGINRLVQRNINRAMAKGVVGTTLQTWEFDGLSRLTKATDDNDPTNLADDSTVERRYDSLSRPLEELQNGQVISVNWTSDDDRVNLVYPNGRTIGYALDKLDRLKSITPGGAPSPLANYDYLGYRLLERTYSNGTRLTMLNDAGNADAGYDSLPRLTQMRHLHSDNSLLVGWKFGYNRENFKTHEENLHLEQHSEVYKMDSVYRLVDFGRGTLNATKDGITGTPTQTQAFQLDGVGNWGNTVVDGQTLTQTTNEMNEYTSFGGVPQSSDANGNLTDDGTFALRYDALNRLVEVDRKTGTPMARYRYDSFNRRISKTLYRERNTSTDEYQTDAHTLALWHYNETSGQILDSSGNRNHATPPRKIERGIEGLFDTKAIRFQGQPAHVQRSTSLDKIQDQLTVETWVYLQPNDCRCKKPMGFHCKKHQHKRCDCWCVCKSEQRRAGINGNLVQREGSFELEVKGKEHKAAFTLFVQHKHRHDREGCHDHGDKDEHKHPDRDHIHTRRIKLESTAGLPLNTWIHLAGVYNGQKVTLLVDGVAQQEKLVSGKVKLPRTRVTLGGEGFHGRLEESRISNVARTTFGGSGTLVEIGKIRTTLWDGWREIEEHERVAPETSGELGSEYVSRQYVDGAGIDEHLTMERFDQGGNVVQTTFYHQDARGDVVALSDGGGSVVKRLEYSAYGGAFEVGETGELVALANAEAEVVVYGFQGRKIDSESGLIYFRHRYYSAQQGRFLQRDPMGYVDGMGLYEALVSSPYNYSDPEGKFLWFVPIAIALILWATPTGDEPQPAPVPIEQGAPKRAPEIQPPPKEWRAAEKGRNAPREETGTEQPDSLVKACIESVVPVYGLHVSICGVRDNPEDFWNWVAFGLAVRDITPQGRAVGKFLDMAKNLAKEATAEAAEATAEAAAKKAAQKALKEGKDPRGGRGRLKKAQDKLEQEESIKKAQEKLRKQGLPSVIESTKKSEQRAQAALDNIQKIEDLEEQFGG